MLKNKYIANTVKNTYSIRQQSNIIDKTALDDHIKETIVKKIKIEPVQIVETEIQIEDKVDIKPVKQVVIDVKQVEAELVKQVVIEDKNDIEPVKQVVIDIKPVKQTKPIEIKIKKAIVICDTDSDNDLLDVNNTVTSLKYLNRSKNFIESPKTYVEIIHNLIYQAIIDDNVDILKPMLINNLEFKDNFLSLYLNNILKYNAIKCFKFILKMYNNVFSQYDIYNFCIENDNVVLFELLNFDLNDDNIATFIFYRIVKYNSVKCFDLLMRTKLNIELNLPYNMNRSYNNGLRLIHFAAMKDHYAILERLLNCGAFINELDNYGHTAFYMACAKKSKECMKLLYKKDADINIPSKKGVYPLELYYTTQENILK